MSSTTAKSPEPTRARPTWGPRPRGGINAAWVSDFVGGRALAWLGGIALLLGIVLLLALAVAHGWIGHEARVAMAAGTCLALLAGGVWLHARRGRTEAAVVMVAVATAGWFATAIVAGEVYGLIAPAVAVATAMLGGATATMLAVRWAGKAIAALGLIGALGTPMLLGAPEHGTLLAMLAVGAACAMAVVLWQRWAWLAFAAIAVCTPQWTIWLLQGHGTAADLAVLSAFGGLGLGGAVVSQARGGGHDERMLRSAAALALLNAIILAVAGRMALDTPAGRGTTPALGTTSAACWLGVVALAYIALGARRWPGLPVAKSLRRLLVAIGVVVGDAALALGLHGLILSAAGGASALLLAWVGRRGRADGGTDRWLEVGLGAQISLLLARTLLDVPPSQLSDAPQLVSVGAVAILAATCLGCSRVAGQHRGLARLALEGLGLLAVGYLTAVTLQGPALVGAWALEAIALGQLHRRSHDRVAWYAALLFLGAAAAHALTVEAPPIAMAAGTVNVGAAAVALAAVIVAAIRLAMIAGTETALGELLLAGAWLLAGYVPIVALGGSELAAAWALEAAALAEIHHRTRARTAWTVALVLLVTGMVQALAATPPYELIGDAGSIAGATLAFGAVTLATARMALRVEDGNRLREALLACSALSVAYLAGVSLQGPALVIAWVAESVLIAEIARRAGVAKVSAALAAPGLALAATYALVSLAPPTGLVAGVSDLLAAGVALAVLGGGAAAVGARGELPSRHRVATLTGAGLVGLYLASLVIITAFQPGAGGQADVVLDLTVRQEGQVLLSGFWAVAGLGGLIFALRQDLVALRYVALALLLATVAKVFLYDLSTLTSIYRVLSCLVLGAFLLAGAFAYQRIRPPAPPDLRTVHPSQR